MEVRVCPNCSTENKRLAASCSQCHTSLARVPLSQAQPAAVTQPRPQPLTGQYRPPVRASHPPAPEPTQLGRRASGASPPNYTTPVVPARSGSKAWIVVALLLVVGGVLAGVLLMSPPEPPRPEVPAEVIAVKFLEAKRTHEVGKVLPYLCADSSDRIQHAFGGQQAESAGITRDDVAKMFLFDQPPLPEEIQNADISATTVHDTEAEQGGKCIVRATITQKVKMSLPANDDEAESGDTESRQSFDMALPSTQCDLVLVAEDGHWKVDVDATNKRAAKGYLKMLLPDG